MLTNSNGDLITRLVGGIAPTYRTQKVVKQLLSGGFQTQIIGAGGRIVNADVLASPEGRELLNTAESTGETIKLETRKKYYEGIIEGPLRWRRLAGRYYETPITILVTEEGDR